MKQMNWLKSALFVGAVLVGSLGSSNVFATTLSTTSTEPIIYDGIKIGEKYSRSVPFISTGESESQEYFVEVTGDGAKYISLSGDKFTMSPDKEMVIIDYVIDATDAKVTKRNKTVDAVIEIYKFDSFNDIKDVTEEELLKLESELKLEDKEEVDESGSKDEAEVKNIVSQILFELSFVDEDEDREVFTIIKPSTGNSQEEKKAEVFNHVEKNEQITAYFAILNQGNILSSVDNVKIYIVKGELDNYKKIERNANLLVAQEFESNKITQAEAFSSKVSSLAVQHELSEGLYTGVIVFEDDEKEIERFGNSFYIFPDNSGGMYVEIVDLQLSDDKISIQDPLSVSVELKNAGIVDVEPIVHVELYKGDVLIEKKELKQGIINQDDFKDYLTAFSQQPKGDYVLRAYATYGSIKTAEVEQAVFVTAPVGEINGSVILVVVILLIFIVLITAVAGTSKKRGKKRKKKPYRFV